VDFRLTPEEEGFRREVRDFIVKECPGEIRTGEVAVWGHLTPAHQGWRRKLARRNWVAPAWPREYGGGGMTLMQQFIYNLETARLRAPDPGFIGGFGVSIHGPILIMFASEEQKRNYLPGILSGEDLWCQGMAEPVAGSDAAALQTSALRQGDDYVINGEKIFTMLAHQARYMFLLARTNPDVPKHQGLSYIIVPMNSPGVTVEPLVNMAGSHEFNRVVLEDVRVPAGNLVGEGNAGWRMAMAAMSAERSNIGSAMGQQHAVKDLIQLAREGRGPAQGSPEAALLRHELAERYLETQVALLLSYRVVSIQAKGDVPNYEASAARLYAAELDQRIALTGMRLLRIYSQLAGESRWAPLRGRIEYLYLQSVSATIGGGTSDIMRNVVAQRGLRLPRE
jgi:alkylation response protein AidB-like acyl-CoA dehydrogenase